MATMKFLADNPMTKIKMMTDYLSRSHIQYQFNYKSFVHYNYWNAVSTGFNGRRSDLRLSSSTLEHPYFFTDVKNIVYCLMTNPVNYHHNPTPNKVLNWYDFTQDTGKNHVGAIYSAFDKRYYIDRIYNQMDFYYKLKENKNMEITEEDLTTYEKFIYLFKRHKTMLVPTLKTDIIWHAHMLNSPQYVADTTSALGYILNHDDEVSKTELRRALANTANIWKNEFGQGFGPYGALALAGSGVYIAQSGITVNRNSDSGCTGTPDVTSAIMMASSNSSCGASSCGGGGSCGGGSSCGGCGGD